MLGAFSRESVLFPPVYTIKDMNADSNQKIESMRIRIDVDLTFMVMVNA